MWVTGWLSAFCLGEHDNKPLQRTLITPHERRTNTVEILGCCKMSPLSLLCDTLLFWFPSLPSPLSSAEGWEASTKLFSFHITFQFLLLVSADTSLCSCNTLLTLSSSHANQWLRPKVPWRIPHQKYRALSPAPQEQHYKLLTRRWLTLVLHHRFNRNTSHVKIVFCFPKKTKQKTTTTQKQQLSWVLSALVIEGCSRWTSWTSCLLFMRTLYVYYQMLIGCGVLITSWTKFLITVLERGFRGRENNETVMGTFQSLWNSLWKFFFPFPQKSFFIFWSAYIPRFSPVPTFQTATEAWCAQFCRAMYLFQLRLSFSAWWLHLYL